MGAGSIPAASTKTESNKVQGSAKPVRNSGFFIVTTTLVATLPYLLDWSSKNDRHVYQNSVKN
jgi:hypothetical protein